MLITKIKSVVRRNLRLEPIQKVLRKLKRKKIVLKELDALEIFGYTGEYHTRFYAPFVHSLEVWEIDPKCEESLKKNLPQARIKITDSFREIKNTGKKFDLIVVDNPMSMFGDNCEHFNLFPDIFNITKNQAILILNVIPKITAGDKKNWPDLFNEKQLEHRRKFYKVENPDNIELKDMISSYKGLCTENGLEIAWFFFQRRTSVFYLVCRISKQIG